MSTLPRFNVRKSCMMPLLGALLMRQNIPSKGGHYRRTHLNAQLCAHVGVVTAENSFPSFHSSQLSDIKLNYSNSIWGLLEVARLLMATGTATTFNSFNQGTLIVYPFLLQSQPCSVLLVFSERQIYIHFINALICHTDGYIVIHACHAKKNGMFFYVIHEWSGFCISMWFMNGVDNVLLCDSWMEWILYFYVIHEWTG